MSELIANVGDIVFVLELYRNIINKVIVVSMNGDKVDYVVPIEPFEKSFVPAENYRGLFLHKKSRLVRLAGRVQKAERRDHART